MSFEYLDIFSAQYGYVVKTLCQTYNLDLEDLCAFRYDNLLLTATIDKLFVRHVRRIPVYMKLPLECMPTPDRLDGADLKLDFSPLPDQSDYDRYNVGLHEYRMFDPSDIERVVQDRKSVRFWKWNVDSDHFLAFVIFCEKRQLREFYRYQIRISKMVMKEVLPPILPQGMLNEIYENSIGFLLKGKEEKNKYAKYDIPYKRGILLCGKPGCGKTMSCKWLRSLAMQNDFHHKVITLTDYEEAKQHGHMRNLFSMPKGNPGIIFFDDMDVMVKDRNQNGHHDLMNFLTHLDGINPNEGVVYVFTTNYLKELDEAFVRPGRIDLFLTFNSPPAKLRKQFVEQRFHDDLKQFVSVDDLVERTKDYSFAEVEEVRKLLAIDLIHEREISIDRTFKVFERHRKDFAEREKFGFGRLGTEDGDDEIDEDENYLVGFPGINIPGIPCVRPARPF